MSGTCECQGTRKHCLCGGYRREQLDTLLYIRLYPLRRFLRQRLESARDDEALYEETVAKILRVERICNKVKGRLYAGTGGLSPLDIWAAGPDDAPLPSAL